VPNDQLRAKWRARDHAVPIMTVPHFVPQGLVLGAGTVLLAADASSRLTRMDGQEARLLALLSAAYGKAVAPSVLGNIRRAAKSWCEGDECLAYIHLAHARLPESLNADEAARRLFMADGLMKAGTPPRAVFAALDLDARYIEAVEKLYNPEQPRVPAGSGRTSGEWTRILSRLATLDVAQAAELGAFASRVIGPGGAAAVVFGLLFVPSPNNIRVEGEVPEIPGLRYAWNRDETVVHLTYDHGGAQLTVALHLDDEDIRDENGNIVGKVIGGNRISIDAAAVLPDLVKQDEPRLCPAPSPDRPGSDQGKPYDENRARRYEDFVKLIINPPPIGPTPSGFVYELPNPMENGKPVTYDDCELATGRILGEIKGPGYANLLKYYWGQESIAEQFLDQSERQLAASGGRHLVWFFAEQEAADFARRLFDNARQGRERITVVYVPWTTEVSR